MDRKVTEQVYERARELMEAPIGEELVALDAHGGDCFAFNDIATSIWRHLSEPKSLSHLREKLLDEYDVSPEQCDEELTVFLEALCQQKLVRLRQ